jgi:hypothetical protein
MLAAAVAEWSKTRSTKGSRSAATVFETSCCASVYERFTRNFAPRFRVIHPNAFPAWWMSARSRLWIKFGQPISPPSLCRKGFYVWWRSSISIPGICTPSKNHSATAGSSPTVLTRNSVLKPWGWTLGVGVSRRSSIPTKDISLYPRICGKDAGGEDPGRLLILKRISDWISLGMLWRRCKDAAAGLPVKSCRSGSAGYGDGWESEISLAHFLWRSCRVRPHNSLGGRTPHALYAESQLCSARAGLTMSGAEPVQ